MAKRSDSERVGSPSAEPHGLLRGLIDVLHHLVIMMSSLRRHKQIHGSPMGDSKSDYDIWKKLGSHVEQVSAESQPDTKPPAISKRAANGPIRHDTTTAEVREFNQLTEHSKQKAVNQLLPRMDEQMQRKTMDHINISLILAREGNEDGAKLHIELAESAMHTASRFMSHEEYEIFEQKVEHRLESILDRNRPDDSAQ